MKTLNTWTQNPNLIPLGSGAAFGGLLAAMPSLGRFQDPAPTQTSRHTEESALPGRITDFVEILPTMVVVLNEHRRVVHANQAACKFFGWGEAGDIFGAMVGDLVRCARSRQAGGCGQCSACGHCEFASAIRSAAESTDQLTRECHIQRSNGLAYDLRIQVQPFRSGQRRLFVLSITDISDTLRRQALERLFFHDILNAVESIRDMVNLLGDRPSEAPRDIQALVTRCLDQVKEDLACHRILGEAESADFKVRQYRFPVAEILSSVAEKLADSPSAAGRTISVCPVPSTFMVSDPDLIKQVLVRMLQNALEATEPGGEVRLGASQACGIIDFWVWNSANIPEHIRSRIFLRSFSTKSKDRGLGTYEQKLIGERVLGGEVDFQGDGSHGTTFHLRLSVDGSRAATRDPLAAIHSDQPAQPLSTGTEN